MKLSSYIIRFDVGFAPNPFGDEECRKQACEVEGRMCMYARIKKGAHVKATSLLILFAVMLSACGSDDDDRASQSELRAFVAAHWDSTRYIDGLYYTFYRNSHPPSIKDACLDTVTYVIVDESSNVISRSFTHHAWCNDDGTAVDDDIFLENLGRYNQFNFGWDDFPTIGSEDFPEGPNDSLIAYVSPNRQKYRGMLGL